MNVGYGRQAIADVAATQMAKLPYFHSFGVFSNEPLIRLAERFSSSPRRHGPRDVLLEWLRSQRYPDQGRAPLQQSSRPPAEKKIIARLGSYHGSTVAAGSLSGLAMMHETFDLPIPGILHTLSTDYHRRPRTSRQPKSSRSTSRQPDATHRDRRPAHHRRFIAEPITGTGGVLCAARLLPGGQARSRPLRHPHDRRRVITGSAGPAPGLRARPGFEARSRVDREGPDERLLPMSACLLSARVRTCSTRTRARTPCRARLHLSGHPVGAAIANANLDILEREDLPGNAARVGTHLMDRLRERLLATRSWRNPRQGITHRIELDADRAVRNPLRNTARSVASSARPASRRVSSCAGVMTAPSQPSPRRSLRPRRMRTRSSSAWVAPSIAWLQR